MDKLTIAEEAYKNGYEKGLKDAVKHGRWHEIDGETEWECHYRCSKCFTRSYELTNYCPNCGANMRGKEE